MMNERLTEIGRLVKQARKIAGENEGKKVTQVMFADKLGISRSYLADMESGRIEPSLSILTRVADLTGLPLDFFQVSPGGNRGVIPILGTVRAGEPIEAVENVIGHVALPVRGATDDYFGLAVVGDSMDQTGIHEGDIVIIRKQPDVENGQIAAVIIDEEAATIKKFYRNGKYISLNPSSSNPDHQPRIIDPAVTPVRILGRVIKAVINI